MKNNVHHLALFGDPVSHSLSPQIHQHFARQCGLSIDYQLISVRSDQFADKAADFFAVGGRGANVTLPHKNRALSWVRFADSLAETSQAVNTLVKGSTGVIEGYNTDGIGFIKDLQQRCHFNCAGKRILILGAGGATQGIVPSIMAHKPQMVTIANRSVDKAQLIVQQQNCEAVTFEQLNEIENPFDLIIHASSLGHQGQTLTFKKHHVKKQTIAYDLSYGQAANAFIDHASSANVGHIYDGIGMLIEQAACAFALWFDYEPETQGMAEQWMTT